MTRQEMIDRIREIQASMVDLVTELADIADQDDSEYSSTAQNYLIPTLEIAVNASSRWVSGDANIDEWIEALETEEVD